MEVKKVWQSKTIIFNVLGLGLAVLQVLGEAHIVSPEELTIGMGIGNLLLRFVTNSPVGLTDKPIS